MAQFSVHEQLMLELVNRARLDPLLEAKRFGIDLNKNLAAGTLNGTPKAPLAPNDKLVDAARAHSQFMLDHDRFEHEGIGDGTPSSRIQKAGYTFPNGGSLGENIAINGTAGTADVTTFTLANHEGLFDSAPHRLNILSTNFRELGIGIKRGSFVFEGQSEAFDSVDATQNFARSGSKVFISGVAITDADGDNFYDIGEQRSGVLVDVIKAGVTAGKDTTGTAGNYSIGVAAGSYQVQFHGGPLSRAVNCTVTADDNVKIDLAGNAEVLCSASVTLGSGATTATLLGAANINATGNATNNALLGNRGANILSGLDGNDKLLGGNGNDKLLGGNGSDTLTGAGGKDQLTGGAGADLFDFNALTESASATTRDLIRDFLHGTDHIDLSGIDAITGGSNNAFKFIGRSNFGHVAGQLHYKLFNESGTSLDHTVVEGDVNGDAVADFQIDFTSLIGFTAGDFIL
ncbi:MAG: M10 family metallopeptidase C-terminal domain-containing protein [Proteobacteria bacterium]|nr:M10 family metallopeptidase C-terminal domain-containing protein [Pseudomonadota bacterium]